MNYLLIDERVWHDLQMHVRRIEEKMRQMISIPQVVTAELTMPRSANGYIFPSARCNTIGIVEYYPIRCSGINVITNPRPCGNYLIND